MKGQRRSRRRTAADLAVHFVEGGWSVNLCWVYLDRVGEWESALDGEVASLIARANSVTRKEKVPYWGFPNYRTMFQRGKIELIEMRPGEARLLADFTAWTASKSSAARLIERTLQGGV